MFKNLSPIFSARFLKFCAVGVSGVAVNLGCLALFARAVGLNQNLSAALAIEVSINTNFLVNELWTFRDRREKRGGIVRRWAKFHLVSIVGAALQWIVFVSMNARVAGILEVEAAGGVESQGWLQEWIVRPPAVGAWIYMSQLGGIVVGTFWNFFANFYWTWRRRAPSTGRT